MEVEELLSVRPQDGDLLIVRVDMEACGPALPTLVAGVDSALKASLLKAGTTDVGVCIVDSKVSELSLLGQDELAMMGLRKMLPIEVKQWEQAREQRAFESAQRKVAEPESHQRRREAGNVEVEDLKAKLQLKLESVDDLVEQKVKELMERATVDKAPATKEAEDVKVRDVRGDPEAADGQGSVAGASRRKRK